MQDNELKNKLKALLQPIFKGLVIDFTLNESVAKKSSCYALLEVLELSTLLDYKIIKTATIEKFVATYLVKFRLSILEKDGCQLQIGTISELLGRLSILKPELFKYNLTYKPEVSSGGFAQIDFEALIELEDSSIIAKENKAIIEQAKDIEGKNKLPEFIITELDILKQE